MKKYFKDYLEGGIKLSEFKRVNVNDEKSQEIKYLIDILGDISLPQDIIKSFISILNTYGGMYNVRRNKETIKGLYDMYIKYPLLSKEALEEISSYYIRDVFELYKLDEVLKLYIDSFGYDDEVFKSYIKYISKKAKERQYSFEIEAKKLDVYKKEYGDTFIEFLKKLITKEHISLNRIIKCIPSPYIIKDDEKQLHDISLQTRIYLGAGYPISYLITRSLIKEEDLSVYDHPSYYINTSNNIILATFSIEEFINSINKEQILIKKYNPTQKMKGREL